MLVGFFVFFRYFFLTKLPVFNDESIYIDWAWRSVHWDGFAFFSQLDGKQPLVLWIIGVTQTWFAHLLWISRFTTASFSILTGLGVWHLTFSVTKQKSVSLLATILYLTLPLFVFFDSQVLFESASTAYTVWFYIVLTWFLTNPDGKSSLVLGVIIGLGVWIKTSLVLLFIPTIALVLLHCSSKPKLMRSTLLWFLYSLLYTSFVLLPLVLQPSFIDSLQQNSRYTFTLAELLQFPFKSWVRNSVEVIKTSIGYLTPAIIIPILFWKKVTSNSKNKFKELILFFVLLCTAHILTYRVLQPRYIVSALVLVVPVLAYVLGKMVHHTIITKRLALACVSLILVAGSVMRVLPQTYLHTLQVTLNDSLYASYFVNWNSGFASQQAVNAIKKEIQHKPARILVRSDAGNPESMVFYSFHASPQQQVSIFDQTMMPELASYSCLTSSVPVYFIARDYQLAGTERFWDEKSKYYNDGNQTSVGVYVPKANCNQEVLNLTQ